MAGNAREEERMFPWIFCDCYDQEEEYGEWGGYTFRRGPEILYLLVVPFWLIGVLLGSEEIL